MSIISVEKIPGGSVSRSKQDGGWKAISVTRNYRLETSVAEDIPVAHANFPKIGEQLNFDGFTLRCKANPVHSQDSRYRRFWYASATWDNLGDDASKDITQQFPVKIWRPITFKEYLKNAEFLGTFREDLTKIDGFIPNGLAIGDRTPIVNSALIARPKQRNVRGRKFTIEQYYLNYDASWESYQDSVNTDQVVISQSDTTGLKWSFTFPKHTLLMEDVGVEEERFDNGKIYFKVTFNFVYHPKTWVHYEADIGRKAHIFVGQWKENGLTYSQNEVTALYSRNEGYQEFTHKVLKADGSDTGQLATASEPIRMNGYGQAHGIQSPHSGYSKTYFLGFLENIQKPWAGLNL